MDKLKLTAYTMLNIIFPLILMIQVGILMCKIDESNKLRRLVSASSLCAYTWQDSKDCVLEKLAMLKGVK